ncbi:hypothetical protein GDO78_012112 [Eleutherodactylus coqui]|uniref:Uncharacterized protein n=1 Tax=Eleutherodactylus coqui TaxID=57060 RepID=A0A8J6F4L3_ELECQ|nr:hypothetical protein GDO78_012112 [Eleutherodactylus coqui]
MAVERGPYIHISVYQVWVYKPALRAPDCTQGYVSTRRYCLYSSIVSIRQWCKMLRFLSVLVISGLNVNKWPLLYQKYCTFL